MRGEIAIRAHSLSKLYRIGERERYKTLRDILAETLYSPYRNLSSAFRRGQLAPNDSSGDNSYIWALKDISFELKHGQALGVIGHNGAGKSTLLKVLSRITEPSEGHAEIHGRIASLLEVGTGFHPELTGRENIFLNGSIIGMKRSEIVRRFDDIVTFAEVEKFIDTPVKHYSSGMYVRLAFSVAAHLDVDILAVDEVLAVGDASFQKKCLGKMEDVRSVEGRSVLFVSHNLGAIRLLTDTCILLSHGKLVAFGPTEDVVNRYLREEVLSNNSGYVDLSAPEWRRGTQKPLARNIMMRSLRLINSGAETTNLFFEQEPITVELTFESKIQTNAVEFIVVVLTVDGSVIFSAFSGQQFGTIDEGLYRVSCIMAPNVLRPGNYRLRLYLRSGYWQDIIAEAATFQILADPTQEDELNYIATNPGLMGAIRVEYPWKQIVRL